jgi:bifunctional DNA-binding transcriptional regulator/antitoxin component of YhaV-PrlF toxin-antitoxin module
MYRFYISTGYYHFKGLLHYITIPPHNGDDFMGDDVEIGLVTDIRPEHTIQKLYKSGSNKLLTTTIPKSWSFRMGLKPGDFIEIWLSPDSTQLVIQKVPPNMPKQFKDGLTVPIIAAADSDAAAAMLEAEKEK